jgi:Zn-dependent peptidase ImmA (M78 family)
VKRGFKSWADKKSLEIRKRIGLRSSDPLDCQLLCKELGIPIITLSDLNRLGFPREHFMRLRSQDSDFFACMVQTPVGLILINNHNSSQKRSNSNIVHELSHVICGHNFSTNIPINGSILREFDKDSEDEANWLAGCLLIPREGLIWASRQGFTINQLSQHFGASEHMARWRYNITGVTKQLSGRKY